MIKNRHCRIASSLFDKPGVVACGIGYKETGGEVTDELSVIASVERKLPKGQLAASSLVPETVEGMRTDVQETGIIHALSHTGRHRPAPGGVSIGHIDVTAGTLGCLVRRDDETFVLSNNHVLADINAGKCGDPVLQPGCYDGGTLQDKIATLADFIPIDFIEAPSKCPVVEGIVGLANWFGAPFGYHLLGYRKVNVTNHVDAAIARPILDDLVTEEILEIGTPAGVVEPELDMPVKKSGRTTGLTTGRITQLFVTAKVQYGEGRTAVFEDQVMAGPMSKGGDSGSVVLDEDNRITGLLFAGSEAVTVINPIQFVLEELNVAV